MPSFFRSGLTKSAPLRTLDIRPDDTDARDYIFQPALTLLPDRVDHRHLAPVCDQEMEGGCVGFALAAVINVSLRLRQQSARARRAKNFDPVSPRMLYEMGRRYDEWGGEDYEGTSLRGAMKGWHKHGVTTEKIWSYFVVDSDGNPTPDRRFTPERAKDALRRPIGAYYRILDSDVSHLQAAILEGDAVLASAWIHSGWQDDHLEKRGRETLKRIPPRFRQVGLHAFAIVGYTPEGFIIQNSWGERWGSSGYALLGYDDWFENRQDAWVARPGPETLDSKGDPRVFVVEFTGGGDKTRAGTMASGLDIEPEAVQHMINTGDRGQLSEGGILATKEEELSEMAEQVLTTPCLADSYRHVVLYAHGGLNSENHSAETAGRLWAFCKERKLSAYFFIWESGVSESILGWFKSTDDASGPTKFSFEDAWESIKKGAGKLVRKAQETLGEGLAPVARRVFWNEMKGRAEGASQPNGGAALFTRKLFETLSRTPSDKYKIHLIAHSAGSIYFGCLYQNVLSGILSNGPSNVELASIQFMAPAISAKRAKEVFFAGGKSPVLKDRFRVHMLTAADEDNDSINIYPSSLLTYVADYLESAQNRVPVLGIRKDFTKQNISFATPVQAAVSVKHGEFDNPRHEIETILTDIAEGKF